VNAGISSCDTQHSDEQQTDSPTVSRVNINSGWKFTKISPTDNDGSFHAVGFDDHDDNFNTPASGRL